ncbi:MAG: hypothetical protein ABSG81_10805 [Acidimicrobiales bacterium]
MKGWVVVSGPSGPVTSVWGTTTWSKDGTRASRAVWSRGPSATHVPAVAWTPSADSTAAPRRTWAPTSPPAPAATRAPASTGTKVWATVWRAGEDDNAATAATSRLRPVSASRPSVAGSGRSVTGTAGAAEMVLTSDDRRASAAAPGSRRWPRPSAVGGARPSGATREKRRGWLVDAGSS